VHRVVRRDHLLFRAMAVDKDVKVEADAGSDVALDTLSVYSIRMLCADMVEKASSGHLGAPFGCAPLANALWSKIMKFSPQKRWMNRDRFVLSAGHASALQYSMLYLIGQDLGGPYEVSMEDLKQFRAAGSSTPGHPEFRMTSGIETTTGPLGQGFANGVGMAIAEAHLSARFNREGYPLFDHYTYILAGDGCLMEGISQEASSLAGHLKLHKLIVFYDDNNITIDGTCDLAFSEDVGAKYAAYKWNVIKVDDADSCDSAVFERAVNEAKSQTEKPTIICLKTTIGCGAGKGIEGTHKAHGGKFATIEELRKKWLSPHGLRQSGNSTDGKVASMLLGDLKGEAMVAPKFYIPPTVLKRFRDAGLRGDKMAGDWEAMVKKYCEAFRATEPELIADLQGRMEGKYLTDSWQVAVSDYLHTEMSAADAGLATMHNNIEVGEPDAKKRKVDSKFKHKAGRVYASEALKIFVEHNPSCIGGSADVASSVGAHFPAVQGHFLPACYSAKVPGAGYQGRYIHFGVREHACVGILNGISSYGFLIPYSALFTIFFQYALPAIRMASISKFPVLFIGTHDSIDVGEDGPTHQPVEVLPQLRAMPNLLVIRPANVEEMVGAFEVYAEEFSGPRSLWGKRYVDPKPLKRRPVFLMTSRGELGLPYKCNTGIKGLDGLKKGAYVIHDCFDENGEAYLSPNAAKVRPLPDIVLIGSGQEVALVMKTKEILLQCWRKLSTDMQASFKDFPAMVIPPPAAPLKVRVVSMPCWELFDEQDQEYQDSVLLSNYDDILRIYVEKAATKNTGHDKYAHLSILMPSYGLSGKAADVEKKLEFTPEYIASKVWARWADRGRRLPMAGDEADQGYSTWVSRMTRRVGSH